MKTYLLIDGYLGSKLFTCVLFLHTVVIRRKVFYAQRCSDGSFIHAHPPAGHEQRRSFLVGEESRVLDRSGVRESVTH